MKHLERFGDQKTRLKEKILMKHNSNRWPALLDKDGPECPKRPYQKSSNFRQGATLMDILQQTDSTKKKSRRPGNWQTKYLSKGEKPPSLLPSFQKSLLLGHLRSTFRTEPCAVIKFTLTLFACQNLVRNQMYSIFLRIGSVFIGSIITMFSSPYEQNYQWNDQPTYKPH